MGEIRAQPRLSRRLRQAVFYLGICLILYCLFFVTSSPSEKSGENKKLDTASRLSPSLLNSLFLTEKQCVDTFPGLTLSIDDVVAEGPFKLKDGGDMGPLQGRIKDGKIYIINAQRKVDLSTEMVNSRTAALHQLHRAIITSPEPLPDTVFAINFQDQPFGTAWAYSRSANPSLRSHAPDARNFLMPHFSFWAWKLPFVGSMWRAAAAITALETRQHPAGFSSKIPKAVWRGTTWFNSVHNPRLRQNLLAEAKGKRWADVEALKWAADAGGTSGQNATNALPIEEFCRYKYVLHTEGVAYSGRFQFLQMCASVVLTPPIAWMQHTTHLVRPLFASDIPELRSKTKEAARERARAAWPVGYAPDEANIVFVAPDWSDLEDTILWLESHPEVAEGIARRQRELFVGGGYFSPAAEVCYWRALIRGWSKVVRIDEEEWRRKNGVTYEAFSLSNGD